MDTHVCSIRTDLLPGIVDAGAEDSNSDVWDENDGVIKEELSNVFTGMDRKAAIIQEVHFPRNRQNDGSSFPFDCRAEYDTWPRSEERRVGKEC